MPLMTLKDLAAFTGVSYATLRQRAARGSLRPCTKPYFRPADKLNGPIYIPPVYDSDDVRPARPRSPNQK
jgi:hypothetical protein